jgi:hypothetical protein
MYFYRGGQECFKNECLFDTDNTYVLFTKLIDISRSELIAKILVDIIEEDKQNDIGSKKPRPNK